MWHYLGTIIILNLFNIIFYKLSLKRTFSITNLGRYSFAWWMVLRTPDNTDYFFLSIFFLTCLQLKIQNEDLEM